MFEPGSEEEIEWLDGYCDEIERTINAEVDGKFNDRADRAAMKMTICTWLMFKVAASVDMPPWELASGFSMAVIKSYYPEPKGKN